MSLSQIQQKLKAPKGQFNKFGNFYYRSCEDILEAVKPVLKEFDMSVTLSDEIEVAGDRVYVKATASLHHRSGVVAKTTAYAREPSSKKGMDDSQITGTASSYARKYALNGLFAIDDTKDADTDEVKRQGDNAQTIDQETVKSIKELCLNTNYTEEKFCVAMGIKNIEELTVQQVDDVMKRFENRKKAQGKAS